MARTDAQDFEMLRQVEKCRRAVATASFGFDQAYKRLKMEKKNLNDARKALSAALGVTVPVRLIVRLHFPGRCGVESSSKLVMVSTPQDVYDYVAAVIFRYQHDIPPGVAPSVKYDRRWETGSTPNFSASPTLRSCVTEQGDAYTMLVDPIMTVGPSIEDMRRNGASGTLAKSLFADIHTVLQTEVAGHFELDMDYRE